MSEQLNHLLGALKKRTETQGLDGITHGIEKESLRVDKNGHIALSPHPKGLGSPLTHEYITTDFSEALIEFITPVFDKAAESINFLKDTHSFLYSQLENDELLWTSSMPCIIDEDEGIPLGQYGSSNIGKLKTLYRRGLGHRYSRAMQTISGIHYNFSLPDSFWLSYQELLGSEQALQEFKTEQYLNLIRNFRRYSWLLIYLFGASPAVCKSFLKNSKPHTLSAFDDYTYHMPYGTSLRMGDLGYTSDAQKNLFISYNSLDEYLEGMQKAINTPYPPYAEFDNAGDDFQQINSNILQIENEFYSTIRPKRVAKNGERPIQSLKRGGIEYIEVRCLDLNPFFEVGIDETQIHFLNSFLLYCLLKESPSSDENEHHEIQENIKAVVEEGRKPGLELHQNSELISISNWANEILSESKKVGQFLDQAYGSSFHEKSVDEQLEKVANSALTPSAKILEVMKEKSIPYFPFAMGESKNIRDAFKNDLNKEKMDFFKKVALESNEKRAEIESSDSMTFEEYVVQANQI